MKRVDWMVIALVFVFVANIVYTTHSLVSVGGFYVDKFSPAFYYAVQKDRELTARNKIKDYLASLPEDAYADVLESSDRLDSLDSQLISVYTKNYTSSESTFEEDSIPVRNTTLDTMLKGYVQLRDINSTKLKNTANIFNMSTDELEIIVDGLVNNIRHLKWDISGRAFSDIHMLLSDDSEESAAIIKTLESMIRRSDKESLFYLTSTKSFNSISSLEKSISIVYYLISAILIWIIIHVLYMRRGMLKRKGEFKKTISRLKDSSGEFGILLMLLFAIVAAFLRLLLYDDLASMMSTYEFFEKIYFAEDEISFISKVIQFFSYSVYEILMFFILLLSFYEFLYGFINKNIEIDSSSESSVNI